MARLVKITRTSQPSGPVGINQEYVGKLASVILPIGNGAVDVVSGRNAVKTSTLAKTTPHGIALSNDAANAYFTMVGACQSSVFSRIAVVRINSLSQNGTISNSRPSNLSNGAQWQLRTTGDIGLNKANVVQIAVTTGLGLVVGGTYVLGLTYDGTVANLYSNGKKVGTGSSAQTFTHDTFASFGVRNTPNGEQAFLDFSLHVDFNVALPEAEMKLLTSNPWQLFEPEIIVLQSAAAIVDCTAGNVVASGNQAVVSTSVTIDATVGNAVAAGSQAVVSTSVTVGSSVGDAVAAGSQANITSSITVDCTVGATTADGVQASVYSEQIVSCSVGSAIASGVQAVVSTSVTVACAVGNAIAAGLNATIETVFQVDSVGDLYSITGNKFIYSVPGGRIAFNIPGNRLIYEIKD